MMVEPCSKIPMVYSLEIHLDQPPKDSKQLTFLPLTPQLHSGQLDHMVHVVEQPSRNLELLKNILLFQVPHKGSRFPTHLVYGPKEHIQVRNVLYPNPNRPTKGYASTIGCRAEPIDVLIMIISGNRPSKYSCLK